MAEELIRGVALIVGFLLLCRLLGISVELDDLDDPNWGKARWGNTRYDITGGHAATLRAMLRITRGVYELLTSNKKDLDPKHDPWEVFKEFAKYKFAPWPSFVYGALYGQDVIGQPSTFKVTGDWTKDSSQNIILKMVEPMVLGDFADALSTDGWIGVAKTLPALGGMGVQTYPFKERPNESPAQKLLYRRRADSGYGKESAEDKERSQLIRKLEDDARTGKPVTAEIEAAVKTGKLKPDDRDAIAHDSSLTSDQLDFKRASITDAMDAFEIMSDKEKAAVRQILLDKAPAIENLRVTEQEAARARFQKLTGEAPRKKVPRHFSPKYWNLLKERESATPRPTP